jgi:uncharacterized membrane protein
MHKSIKSLIFPENPTFFTPEKIFLLLGLIFGIFFCVMVPYGAGFDEEQHVARIYDISGFHFLPNRNSPEGTISFNDFVSLSYQRRYYQTPAEDLFSKGIFLKPLNRNQMAAFPTRSIYPPVSFLPQAVLAGIFWRWLAAPVIPVAILCRLAGLLGYLLGCYLTLRLLPIGKWVFTFLALAPMALFQAATLNADGYMNAISFVFIGLTLHIFADPQTSPRPWKVWTLAAAIVLLGLAKPGAIFILPLLLILAFRKNNSRSYVLLLSIAVILAVVFTFGYNALSVNGSHFSDDGGQSLSKQMTVVTANPLDFVKTFVLGNILAAGRYFKNWVGVYGYWNGTVPEIIYWLFPFSLLGALVIEPVSTRFSKKVRLLFAAAFLLAAAATAFLYSYLHYTPGDLNAFGKQGRYFIPMAPLFYLSIAGLFSLGVIWEKRVRMISVGIFTVILALYAFGLYTTYYTFCDSTLYTFGACTQPVYKNLDLATTPDVKIAAGDTLTQEFLRTCSQFEAVDVFVKSAPSNSKGTLRYSILDNSDRLVSAQDIPLSSIVSGKFLELPAKSTNYQLYKIKLEAVGLAPSEKLSFATNEDSSYGNGLLTVAGKEMDTDLIFQFICPGIWQSAH